MSHAPPTLLTLPPELRYQIYDSLCPATPLSYPYPPPTPITAISHAKPPLPLLLLHPSLTHELRTYYFTRCTIRIVAQSFSNASSIANMPAASLFVVRNMRRVELLLLPGTVKAALVPPDVSLATRAMSELWLSRQAGLLREEAAALRVVVVSLRRVSWNHEWSMGEEMEGLLRPLGVLRGRGVEFRVGEVMGPAAVEGEMRRELGRVLEGLNGGAVRCDDGRAFAEA